MSSVKFAIFREDNKEEEAQMSPRGRATHRVSWNRAKFRADVRRIAFAKSCNMRMTFKATQGHWKWHESIGLGPDAYDVIKLTFYKDVDCLGACQFATAA